MSQKRTSWTSSLGVILAVAGSTVGLGKLFTLSQSVSTEW